MDVPPAVSTDLSDSLKVDPKETQSEREPHFTEISLEELVERNRQALIKKHGNIPEIEIFLKYAPFNAIQRQEEEYEAIMTIEKQVEYLRAMSVLFPSETNEQNYQDALHDLKESQEIH